MRFTSRSLIMAAAFLGALSSLHAQETWDNGFKLSIGSLNGASEAGLGTGTHWAITAMGSYRLFPKGSILLEGGYRILNERTSHPTDLVEVSEGAKGLFAGAMYLYDDFGALWGGVLDGLYLQAGGRYQALKAKRIEDVRTSATDTTPDRTKIEGDSVHLVSPVFGLGFRFNDKISLEINSFRLKGSGFQTVNGSLVAQEKTFSTLELALGIHF